MVSWKVVRLSVLHSSHRQHVRARDPFGEMYTGRWDVYKLVKSIQVGKIHTSVVNLKVVRPSVLHLNRHQQLRVCNQSCHALVADYKPMVLVAQAAGSICETQNRPLRCGWTEHITGGRYAHGRDHHPLVLHGRRPLWSCQQAFRCAFVRE